MLSQPRLEIPAVAKATAAFDPPVIAPGQQSFLRVTFNALEESIEWPASIAGPARLELRPGARGQMLQIIGTNFEPRTAFNVRARALGPGSFTVPEFAVRVGGKPVLVPAARLEVVSAPATLAPPALQLLLEMPATNLVVGQPVQARLLLPGTPSGGVQGLMQPQLSGQGFLADTAGARQIIEGIHHNGASVPAYIYETTLTPLTTGKLTVFAQGFAAGNRFSGPIVISGHAIIPGGVPQYTLLESDPIELSVRPLPRDGELPGFTGAIGSFTVGPPQLATNSLRVGDPVKLTVTITNRGVAPLARLVPPPPPRAREWQVLGVADFAPVQILSLPQPAGLRGVVTFTYTLVPLTDSARATPPIPFSCFDPETDAYADLTIPSVPVTVAAGAVPGDHASVVQARLAEPEPDKEPELSGLAATRGLTAASLVPLQQRAWFPLVQLAPAAAFLGLLGWDRRRRYLEAHPDVVLRRRARRALRRQRRILRQAARAADAPRFAAAAVTALRAACAPHYPAEPRALVGADVLPLLPEPERSGRSGEVVRRFFAVTDANAFSTAGARADELLALQPEIERVLEQLEARL